VRERAVVTRDGTEHPVDTIIYGTGFKIMDMPVADRVHGIGGERLADAWAGTPQAHHGISIAGFPNFFMLLGPNTGLGHTSVVFMIEAQIDYVADALRTLQERGLATAEVRREAQDASTRAVQERLKGTVWSTGGCASWYLDEHGRNAVIWPGFTWPYKRRTLRFDAESYDLRTARPAPPPAQRVEYRAAASRGERRYFACWRSITKSSVSFGAIDPSGVPCAP